MAVGSRVRDFRKQRGLTLQQLADGLEVSCSYLSAIERNVKRPSVAMVKKLAQMLNVSPTYLFETERIYGEKIAFIRRARGLSIEELAELSGIEARQILAFEAGTEEPNLQILERLANALSVTARYFLEKSSDIVTIGERVRRERERQGLTGMALAERAGISPGMISQLENDQTEPSLETLESIAQALGVSVCYFLLEQEDVTDLIASLNADTVALLGDPRIQSVLRAIRDMNATDLKFILNFIMFYKRNHPTNTEFALKLS